MRALTMIPAALLVLWLAGCDRTVPPSATTPESSQAATVQDTAPVEVPAAPPTPAPTDAVLSVEPTEMQACDKTYRTATLHWDASKLEGVNGVEIWMSNLGKEPKLFGRAPNVGEKTTGAWVRPGATFILKNKLDGSEISRAEIKSVPCT
jgi:hypothetical protein